nr:PEP-CTERM sorting domain-containing protein [uncultured Rhodopila sp.]
MRKLWFALAATAALTAMPGLASATPGTLVVTLPGVPAQNFTLVIDTGTDRIDSFTIDNVSAPAGFNSYITLLDSNYSAYYEAQFTVLQTGGDNINYTFLLDLEALNTPFPSSTNWAADAVALLTNTSQLTTNLDTAATDPAEDYSNNSAYTFVERYDDGTVIAGSTIPVPLATPASGEVLNVTAPEPASIALLATSVFGLGMARRRRRV